MCETQRGEKTSTIATVPLFSWPASIWCTSSCLAVRARVAASCPQRFFRTDIGTVSQEQLYGSHVCSFCSKHERCLVVVDRRARVGVGTALQQQFGHAIQARNSSVL